MKKTNEQTNQYTRVLYLYYINNNRHISIKILFTNNNLNLFTILSKLSLHFLVKKKTEKIPEYFNLQNKTKRK